MFVLSEKYSSIDWLEIDINEGFGQLSAISFTPYSSILENQVQSKFLKPVSENEIGNIIQKLKNERSTGSDGISNKMLNIVTTIINYHTKQTPNPDIATCGFAISV